MGGATVLSAFPTRRHMAGQPKVMGMLPHHPYMRQRAAAGQCAYAPVLVTSTLDFSYSSTPYTSMGEHGSQGTTLILSCSTALKVMSLCGEAFEGISVALQPMGLQGCSIQCVMWPEEPLHCAAIRQ